MWHNMHRFMWGLLFLTTASTAAIFSDSDFQQKMIERPDGAPWEGIVGIEFTDDGERIFAWERGGRVWIIDNDNPVALPLVDINDEVLAYRDHGLLGFALDPQFEQNGHIYLSYIVDRHHLLHCQEPAAGVGIPICDNQYDPNTSVAGTQATIGRVVRYTLNQPDGHNDYRLASTVDYRSRKVLIGETAQTGMPLLHQSHGVGQIVFGTDGSLLVTFGDGASFYSHDFGSDSDTPYQIALDEGIITPEENVGAFRSQTINSLAGKLLRVNPVNGDGYESNPFYRQGLPRSPASRVWALGLRNPYRITLKPGTGSHNPADGDPGVIYIGDVGNRTWEELNIVEQAGENFGWPLYEGHEVDELFFSRAPLDSAVSGILGCDVTFDEMLAQQSPQPLSLANPCGGSTLTKYPAFAHKRPALAWHHTQERAETPQFDGGDNAVAVGLGDAIPGSAAVPAIGQPFIGSTSTAGVWYQGDDFPERYRNTYFHGDFSGQWIRNIELSSGHKVEAVNEFANDAGGVVFIATNPVSGQLYYVSWASILYQISYAPGGNRPPKAAISASTQYGPSPLDVQFSALASTDPEGEGFNASWSFGDGAGASSLEPLHRFVADSDAPQSFEVTLTVTDNGEPAQSDQATALISVNNTPPQVNITSPVNNSFYPLDAESSYQLEADISDAEHSLEQLRCGWKVELFHNSHTHEDPIIESCGGTVHLSPVGCDGEQYHYEVSLTVTDEEGLSTTDVARLYPDCSSVVVPIAVDDQFEVQLGQATALAILANDLNAVDGVELTVVSNPSQGRIDIDESGNVWYQPNGSIAAADSFQYQLRSPSGITSRATVALTLHNDGNYLQLAPVTISPNGGSFDSPVMVDLSHSDGAAQIVLNDDLSEPDLGSSVYGGSFELSRSATVRARAYRDGWLPSEVSTAEFVFTSQLPPSLQQGLLGYWPLDDVGGSQASDLSGNEHHGVVSGAQWDDGWNGGALRFDGSDDRVAIADAPELRFGASDSYSLSAWVYADGSQGGWSGVVTKARENKDWYGLWISASDRWVFGASSNINGPAISSGWQHLLVLQDSGSNSRHLYLNGTLVGSGAAIDSSDLGDLIFGDANGVDENFRGWLDEVRLYGRALDAAEINALATTMPTPSEPEPITTNTDSAEVNAGEIVDIDLFANDFAIDGIDGGTLQIIQTPVKGQIVGQFDNGVVQFMADSDASGNDGFSYQVADINGNLSAVTAVSITIVGDRPEPQDLLGYWPLDGGTAADLSGNGHHGVVSGAMEVSGRFDGALRFDGVDDLVRIAHSDDHSFGPSDSYSLSAWVQADSDYGGWSGIITKGRQLRNWWGLWISAPGRWTYGTRSNIYGPGIDEQWRHLMLVQDGDAGVRRFYLDGVVVASAAASDSSDPGDLLFGGSASVDEPFAGVLDQVRLFGRALSGSEVTELASEAAAGGPGTLITHPDQAQLIDGTTVLIDLLANDSASRGLDASTVMVVNDPSAGSIVAIDNVTGAVTYQHNGTGVGSDSFRYQVQDSEGQWSKETQVSITIVADVGSEPLPLLGYWPLDGGSANDVSGNGLDGVISGAVADPGLFGGGLRFDGVDDVLVIAHDPRLAFAADDSFTLSVWVQADLDSSGWRGVVTKSRDDAPWYGLWIDPSDNWVFGSNRGNGQGADITPAWHHLVLVQDGASLQRYLYVDGERQLNRASTGGDGLGDLIFGGSGGVDEPFKGRLDEVRLYEQVLSSAEVQALMLLVPEPSEDSVVANDDNGSVAELGQVSLDLLGNDSSTSGFDLFSWELIDNPTNGTVIFNPETGLATYTHTGGGDSDQFRYRISSNQGSRSEPARVVININYPEPPTITLSTVADEISNEESLRVYWQFSGDETAFDHVHLSLDGMPHVTLHDYSSGEYDFGAVAPGEHAIRAWLVSSSHLPLGNPGSEHTITVTVYQQPSAVTFSQPQGSYEEPLSVALSNGGDTAIYYTLDGSIPNLSSPRYEAPLLINADTTVNAASIDDSGRLGDVVTAVYRIGADDGLPSAGLVAYWSLDRIDGDNVVLDDSGQGHSGINNNAVAVQGHVNGALYFNGSDAFVEVADGPELRFDRDESFTLSLWVMVNGSINSWTAVVTKSREEKPWYGLWIAPWRHWIFGGNSNITGGAVTSGWHHLVLEQDGRAQARRFYVDGRLINNGASQDANGSGLWWFGAAPSVDEFFDGYIDEVRLYDRVLNGDERDALLNQ